ncbi:hypothetical protein ACLOJK_022886 [Asimina triloba]
MPKQAKPTSISPAAMPKSRWVETHLVFPVHQQIYRPSNPPIRRLQQLITTLRHHDPAIHQTPTSRCLVPELDPSRRQRHPPATNNSPPLIGHKTLATHGNHVG